VPAVIRDYQPAAMMIDVHHILKRRHYRQDTSTFPIQVFLYAR
jgi:hypothetical protein